jgi:hypothetical protein
MRLRHCLTLIASIPTVAPAVVLAQKDLASCKVVFDATQKQRGTPFHMYTVLPTSMTSGKPRQDEMIQTKDKNYLKVDDKWKVSPFTPEDGRKQEEENIKNAKAYNCHRVREESVGGVAATVYAIHSESDDADSDGQIWIANGSGLPLKTEIGLDSGANAASKDHISTRYEYTNVQAPPVSP